jgi:hypothetical protein
LLWLSFLFAFAVPKASAQQDAIFPSGNGAGTTGSPFQITNVEDLVKLALHEKSLNFEFLLLVIAE